MATQFYARYIPPSKPSEPTKAHVVKPTDVPVKRKRKRKTRTGSFSESPEPVVDSTRTSHHVANGNVPDILGAVSKSDGPTGKATPREKETKERSRKAKAVTGEETKVSSKAEEDAATNTTLNHTKKKRRKKITLEDDDLDKGKPTAITENPRHEKILAKFERSSKLAASLPKEDEDSSANKATKNDPRESPELERHGLVPLPQPEETPDDHLDTEISALPEWLRTPTIISAQSRIPFKNLSLHSHVVSSLESKGYHEAFAIQAGVLPLLLLGNKQHRGDICISASTGSGKTLAYVLPMVESLRDRPATRLRGLIVVPTRELVTQVRETLDICAQGTGLKVGTAVGSKPLKEEQNLLITKGQRYDPQACKVAQEKRLTGEEDLMDWSDDWDAEDEESGCLPDFVVDYTSGIDILICTPGRLVDHMRSTKGFTLEHVQWLVIDEADRLLDESFQQWVEVALPALQALPKRDDHTKELHDLFHIHEERNIRKIILSATMTKDISKLLSLQLNQPKWVALQTNSADGLVTTIPDRTGMSSANLQADIDLPSTLKEVAVPVKTVEDKPLYLVELLATSKVFENFSDAKFRKRTSRRSFSSSDEPDSDTSSSGSDTDSETSDVNEARSGDERPSNMRGVSSTHGVLVFTNNNENATRLAHLLTLLRPAWADRMGSLTKSTATSAGRRKLAAFRKRKLSVLIVSDRASRGLDIQDLAQVVNYDMPSSLTSYVHRVGRTARAGKVGVATTLVAHHEARWFWNEIARSKKIHRSAKIMKAEGGIEGISEEDRMAYERALKRLGEEARGEVV
jgi:ATP-dependent RNA helicase DDX51/DBP6